MKSIAFAAQAIKCGDADIVVAGGMENMSMIPHYMQGRKGQKFGNIQIETKNIDNFDLTAIQLFEALKIAAEKENKKIKPFYVNNST